MWLSSISKVSLRLPLVTVTLALGRWSASCRRHSRMSGLGFSLKVIWSSCAYVTDGEPKVAKVMVASARKGPNFFMIFLLVSEDSLVRVFLARHRGNGPLPIEGGARIALFWRPSRKAR